MVVIFLKQKKSGQLKDVLPRVEQTLAAGRSTQEPRKGRQQKVSGGCRVQSQDTTLPGSGSEHVCFPTLNNISIVL